MTGAYFAAGPCCFCNLPFAFNPELVPSIATDPEGHIVPPNDPRGVKRPICKTCMGKLNQLRTDHGLDLIPVLAGAYDVTEGFPP